MGLADLASNAANEGADFIKQKAKEGAMEGVDKKIPEIRKQVKEEAEKAVKPIVTTGILVSVGLSGLLAIVVSKAMR
jgi:hypothetical protein